MITKCRGCGGIDSLKLDSGKLVCKSCGRVYKDNFSEVDGAVVSEVQTNAFIEKNSFVGINTYTDGRPDSLRMLENGFFPEIVYEGSKPVKNYRVIGSYKIEVYYE